jgi:hypothetical protein
LYYLEKTKQGFLLRKKAFHKNGEAPCFAKSTFY